MKKAEAIKIVTLGQGETVEKWVRLAEDSKTDPAILDQIARVDSDHGQARYAVSCNPNTSVATLRFLLKEGQGPDCDSRLTELEELLQVDGVKSEAARMLLRKGEKVSRDMLNRLVERAKEAR